jgi:hypothetical protein
MYLLMVIFTARDISKEARTTEMVREEIGRRRVGGGRDVI